MKSQLRIYWPEETKDPLHLSLLEDWLQASGDKYELVWTNQDPDIIILPIPEYLEYKITIADKTVSSDNTGFSHIPIKWLRRLDRWIQMGIYTDEQLKHCRRTSAYRPVFVSILRIFPEFSLNYLTPEKNYYFSFAQQRTETESAKNWNHIAHNAITGKKRFSNLNFFSKLFYTLSLRLRKSILLAYLYYKNSRLSSTEYRQAYYLSLYKMLYPFVRIFLTYPPHYKKYKVDLKRLHLIKRTPGISGMLRVYNEEFFLETCVESHIEYFDEIVVVYDSTTDDRSPQIIQQLQEKYPDKIKIFFYEPESYKIRTWQYRTLPIDHPNSFVNYYNYNLSQTTRQVVTKLDADHIAIPDKMEKVIQRVRDPQFMQNLFLTQMGIVLYLRENGTIFLNEVGFLTGYGDHGFYPIDNSPGRHFDKAYLYEVQSPILRGYKMINAGITYFHIKTWPPRRHIDYPPTKPIDWQQFKERYGNLVMTRTGTDITTLPDPDIYLKELQLLQPEKLSRLFQSIKNNRS